MQYLTIKNWEKHQHYKDRNPPWIKLHREILDDYEMSCLQDASKLHLILIWVLSSQLNNRIPNDAEWVAKKIGATSKVNLKELIDKGFLVVEQSASNALAKCSPERETERETDIIIKSRARKQISLDELSVVHISDWLAEKRSQGKYTFHDEDFILEYFRNYCRSKKKTYSDYASALKNAFEWEACQPKTNGELHGKPTKDDRAKAAVMRGFASV